MSDRRDRSKSDLVHLRYQRLDKSNVAMHMVTQKHNTIIQNTLIKNVKHVNKLDVAETLEIMTHRNKLLNCGTGLIPDSLLLKFVADWSKKHE